jgi:hypothetical protein
VNTTTLTSLVEKETVERKSITDADDHAVTTIVDEGEFIVDDDRASDEESGFCDVDYHESTSSASSGASSVASHHSPVSHDMCPFPQLATADYVMPSTMVAGPRPTGSDVIVESELVTDVFFNAKTASTMLERINYVNSRQDSELRNSTNQKQRQAREVSVGKHEVVWSLHL